MVPAVPRGFPGVKGPCLWLLGSAAAALAMEGDGGRDTVCAKSCGFGGVGPAPSQGFWPPCGVPPRGMPRGRKAEYLLSSYTLLQAAFMVRRAWPSVSPELESDPPFGSTQMCVTVAGVPQS